jgi:cytochrome c
MYTYKSINRMKRVLVLGVCALFIACGGSTERGIASVTTDSSANGSAYNSHDGFNPKAAHTVGVMEAVPAVSIAAPADSAAPVASAVAPTAAPAPDAATQTPKQTPAKATPAPAAAAAKPAQADASADIKKGEALISKSDCLACHKVQDKLLGPSYKDVAAKYPNSKANIDKLVDKIKKGGSGVWGPIPMSPHPALSDDDAKAMVQYILSLN